MKQDRYYYAVQTKDYTDWDLGSYDWEEAVKIAEEAGEDAIIVEIENAETDPFCTAEYHRNDLGEWYDAPYSWSRYKN